MLSCGPNSVNNIIQMNQDYFKKISYQLIVNHSHVG